MPSATAQYGDQLVNGLLAGMKYQNFQEELKMSRLQRAEYEATRGYREGMRSIEMQKQQSALLREQLGASADKIALDYAQPQAEANLTLAKTRTAGAKAETDQTEQSTRFAAALQPSKVAEAESNAGTAKMKQLTSALEMGATQGKQLGAAGLNFTPTDAINLAQVQVNSLGIKDESAKGVMQSQILQGLLTGVEQGKNEIAKTKADLGQIEMKNYLEQVGLAAHVASYGPAGIAGAEGLLGKNHPITMAAGKMIGGVPQQIQKTAPESAWTKEDAKAVSQELKDLNKQRRELQRVARSEEAGTPGKLWGRNVDETAVKTAKQNLADVESDIKDLEARKTQMENPQGIQNSTKFMDKSPSYPPEIVAYAKANKLTLKPNPTQDEIDEAIAFVKSKKKG